MIVGNDEGLSESQVESASEPVPQSDSRRLIIPQVLEGMRRLVEVRREQLKSIVHSLGKSQKG